MDFKTFWLSLGKDERDEFAKRCGTSPGHLRNIAYGKVCGESLAINIERESSAAVTCEELRADVDWAVLRRSPRAPDNTEVRRAA